MACLDWTSQGPLNTVLVSYVRAQIASSDFARLKSCLNSARRQAQLFFDAFSLCEPVAASLENAMQQKVTGRNSWAASKANPSSSPAPAAASGARRRCCSPKKAQD